jgi:hypothetical protein
MTCSVRAFFCTVAGLAFALPASALDGGGFAVAGDGETSYYEQTADAEALTAATADGAASGGLPTSLFVLEAEGAVQYRSLGGGVFEVSIELAERPHERVDAVYDLVLALPLPVGSSARAWRIEPKLSPLPKAEPVSYGGEKIVLKRNVPLEKAWLPLLAGADGGLPDLSASGYAWTLWDTIVRYDASAGATLQAFATFRFVANGAAAPDAADPDNAAYVITWIPTLDDVPPFTLRLDVVEAAQE